MSIDSRHVLAKLQAEPAPLSFAKLKTAYGVKKKGVNSESDLLAALAGDGIHAWPKKFYWHIDPFAQLSAEILAQCSKKALKNKEVKVKGRVGKDVTTAIGRLLLERKLIKYPALVGASSLLVAAGAPEAYWDYVREFVAAKLKKAGIEEAGLEEKIWELLPTLEPELDVPVSTARIRRALGAIDKRAFDEAALRLRELRRVYLNQHDHALALSEQERNLLIDGKDGRYYVAISRLGE